MTWGVFLGLCFAGFGIALVLGLCLGFASVDFGFVWCSVLLRFRLIGFPCWFAWCLIVGFDGLRLAVCF